MKRFMTIPLLLSLLLLTGCGAEPETTTDVQTEAPAAAVSVEETTAAETTAPTAPETQPTSEHAEKIVDYAEVITPYDSYDEFAAMMRENFPDFYLYQLPEDSEYSIKTIELHDNAFYSIEFTRDDGTGAYIEILPHSQFSTVEDIRKTYGGSVQVEDNTFVDGTSRYLFEHYAGGMVAMYGLTGDEPTFFTLIDTTKGSFRNPAEEQEQVLAELYKQLGL